MLSTLMLYLVCIPLLTSATSTILDSDVDRTITIPLNKTVPEDNKEIYGEFLKLNISSVVKVNFTDLSENYVFLIFQVHSQVKNIVLTQKNETINTTIHGTNLGLVNIFNSSLNAKKLTTDTFYIENPHINNVTVQVYMSVHVYRKGDPIPGGCNMEFPVAIAPYMLVNTNDEYITVDAAPASVDPFCNLVNGANIEFYSMYLPEKDYSMDDYFSGIRNMMSLKTIEKYGRKLPKTFLSQRRYLSAYPGTGVVFVVVARYVYLFDNHTSIPTYSVYVPAHSYGCANMDEDGCIIDEDLFTQTLCAFLLFLGLFVSFLGHRFFKTEMFLAGFFSGFIITYILVDFMERTINTPSLVAASVLSGIFFGGIWLLFWWLYGIPVLAVSLVALNAGFILASIFYYTIPANVLFLKDDLNFWALFIIVMCLTALSLVSVTYAGNILCCSVLGGFAFAYAMNDILDSNLKYIMINIVRRSVVPNFQYVVTSPPYSWRDILASMFGLMVAILGWSFQHWHNIGRPPFPPPPRSTRLAAPDHTNITYGALRDERPVQPKPTVSSRRPQGDPTGWGDPTGLPVGSGAPTERTALLANA